jgi:hypothetical protein
MSESNLRVDNALWKHEAMIRMIILLLSHLESIRLLGVHFRMTLGPVSCKKAQLADQSSVIPSSEHSLNKEMGPSPLQVNNS